MPGTEEKMSIPFYRTLGRTGLKVSAFGLGGGAGISDADAMYAFERGVNYFFFSSDLHHHLYRNMAGTVRQLCSSRSPVREQVVLSTVTYVNRPSMISSILLDQRRELQFEYIDVFFWGCMGTDDREAMKRCMDWTAHLKQRGLIRYVGVSFHDLELAADWFDSDLIDVSMLRCNIRNRASKLVFDLLHSVGESRQGTVSFNSMKDSDGLLYHPHNGLPDDLGWPDPGTLYRYALSNPQVDLCLTAWKERGDIDAAFAAMGKGRLSDEEIARLELYGDMRAGRAPFSEATIRSHLEQATAS